MNILANGKPREVPDGLTIAGFLEELGWKPEWVVVEHNGDALQRSRYPAVRLAEGDRLEVVRAVSGGEASRPRAATLEGARLYLVTGGTRPDLDEFLEAVLSSGVDVVQIREKELEARRQLDLAARFRAACDRHGKLFVVNDRVDLALASHADGVHLGQEDLPPAAARAQLGPGAIVGRSTHTPGELRTAEAEDVDYVCVGPVHETPTKPGRPAVGNELVRRAGAECSKPWFAIGGITLDNVEEAVAAGATRIVVVRAITEAPDPAEAAAALRAALPG